MNQPGSNDIVDYLQKKGLEVDEDNYLSIAYPLTLPEDRTDEMMDEWIEVKSGLEEK